MLPSISTALPQSSAAQTASLTAPAAGSGALPASQQVTAIAVPGTGAPSPYSTQTPQQRAQSRLYPPLPERAEILPDPEFWKVPTREAGQQAQAAPMPERALPQINLPQVAQFTAQVMAQQPAMPGATATADAEQAEQAELPLPRRESDAPTGRKSPGLGEARGTSAYTVATQRLAAISFPPSLEPVSA
jgi:hypothetical protein